MKIRIRPDDVSVLQMNDWLAELRDDGSAEPLGESDVAAPAENAAPTEVAVPADVAAPAQVATVRALIGDQLRMPIMWCEMGSCISWYSDPAALGEADARARAISAGWRIDAFGRLACPPCQQADPDFRISLPVVLWDRHTAMARAARIAAGSARIAADRWTRLAPVGTDGGPHDPGIRRGCRLGRHGRAPVAPVAPVTAGLLGGRPLADAGGGDGRPDGRRLVAAA